MRTRYISVVKHAFVVCGCLAVVLGTTTAAHAERSSVSFELKNGPSVTWIPKMPTMTAHDITVGPRTLPSQDVHAGGSITGAGWNFDLGLVFGDRYEVPLFGASIYGAVGSYDAIRAGVDGSIATVRPWTTWNVDFLLPGFGYRYKHRRWLFSATARLGASLLSQNGSVAAGTEVSDLNLLAATFDVFGELEGCRRLDPMSRVCLVVAPRIVGYGFMNGGTIGIRMELGR